MSEALMYKTRQELQIEQSILYDLLYGLLKHNVEDLNRLIELERELTLREGA